MDLLPTVSPDDYRSSFTGLRDVAGLAALLGVSEKQLAWVAYGSGRRYRHAEVKKRRGGVRIISQPADALKAIQCKLRVLLTACYRRREAVHGFVDNRSIATNAAVHAGRRWVFNADLSDFFPSINFGRVRGRLMSRPFSLPAPVATVVAQLCTFNNELPQGAPTSPVISNMVASGLDADLEHLAARYRCRYTRYADDLTFSCESAAFPGEIGFWPGPGRGDAAPGASLESAVHASGFTINREKVRLQREDMRQVVTGLVVNEFPNVTRRYVRRTRAMLRAWQVFGHDAAEVEFLANHDTKHRPLASPRFRQVVKGRIDFIGMVRGNTDAIYEDLVVTYAGLDARYRIRARERRRRSHLPRFEDAMWVLEWEWGQGTGFELQGHGLVTCAHCLRGADLDGQLHTTQEVEAYQVRAPALKVRAEVRWQDLARDVAILTLDQPSGRPLLSGPANTLPVGTEVWAAGFPDHAPGSHMWQDSGRVTKYMHHVGSPRYLVSFTLVQGASGGPVLDESDRVVGIVSMGAESFEAAARLQGTRFGVIPIALLERAP